MSKKVVILGCILFLISRIFFINTQPIFFDSAEYLYALTFATLPQAIVAVHFPLHDGYFILFWPIYHFAKLLQIDPIYTVILAQTVVSLVTVLCFYKVVSFLTNQRIALIASIIISLTPLFWISNITILYEIAYLFFFFVSFYFLTEYLSKKKEFFLHLSAFFLTFAIFTHFMVILWTPLYFILLIYKARKKLIRTCLIFILYFFTLSLLRMFFIAEVYQHSFQHVFTQLYMGNLHNGSSLSLNLKGLLIGLRNFFIPLMRGYTSVVVIVSVVSLCVLFFKNKKYFLYGLFWIAPAIIINQWWEAQLPGRYSLLAGFGLAFLSSYLVNKKIIYTIALLAVLLFTSFSAIRLLQTDIPYLKEAEQTRMLPKNSLLIESHLARPQIQDTFQGTLISVNEPHVSQEKIKKEIDDFLKKKNPVYISSAALSEPYGLYTGPYLHSLALSYAKPSELKSLIESYTLVEYKIINKKDNLILYKIILTKPSPYPQQISLKNHYRRIDYYDPFWRIYVYVTDYFNLNFSQL